MERTPPIEHWSYSSLMSYLRNPLAWYKRYVEKVYDTPSSPSSFVGRAGHFALEQFYKGAAKADAIESGRTYIRAVSDFEISFGKARSKAARKKKRDAMEREYERAISFYLTRAPRYDVAGVEVSGVVDVPGLPLPIKAISDLVVCSKEDPEALDIVDHKFVDTLTPRGARKTLFIIQALFNYYTVSGLYERPVRRFIIQECKRTRNADGSAQMRRHTINFEACQDEFVLFHALINDATREISRSRVFLPNPSDMFEGENSFDIYRWNLVDEV